MTDDRRLRVLRSTQLLDSGPERAFDRLTRLAAGLLGAPVALVSLVDERRQYFKSALGLSEPWATKRETPLSHSFCQYVTRDRASLVVDDAREHPVLRDNPAVRDLDAVAYAGVPLMVQGEAIGAFCVIDSRPRAWSTGDLGLLQDLADSVVSEIDLRLALRATGQREQVYRAIVENLPHGAVFLLDRDLRYVAADGPAVATVLRGASLDTILGHTAAEVISEANLEQILALYRSVLSGASHHVEVRRDEQHFDLSAVPIYDGPTVSHVLVFLYEVTARKNEIAELERVRAELEQKAHALQEASVTDVLTGLLNRRGFMLIAEQELKVAARNAQKLVLFFVDLNFMKTINDTHGHEMGDRALVATGALLRQVFRSSDVIARLGGDEFVVLATDALPPQSPRFNARLHQALLEYNTTEAPFRLSLSVGTAVFDPREPTTLDKLLSEADARMYAEKLASRASSPPR